MSNQAAAPTRLSPLHRKHLSLGAKMESRDGWVMPERFTDPENELAGARSGVGLTDLSPENKVDVKGKEVGEFLGDLLGPGGSPSEPGDVSVGPSTSAHDLKVRYACRLTKDHAVLILDGPHALSETRPYSVDVVRTQRRVFMTNISSGLAGISVFGQGSRETLRGLTRFDVSEGEFPSPACSEVGLAGVHCLILRHDPPGAGLPAFRLYFGREYAEYVWEALSTAAPQGTAVPVGTTGFARLWEAGGEKGGRR